MQRIKALREALDMDQKTLAVRLGVNQSTISCWENGVKTPSSASTAKLADFFGVSVDYLLGRSPHEAPPAPPPPSTGGQWVPVLGRVMAGVPIEAVREVLDYEEIDLGLAKSGEFFALRIRDDSMEPRILEGDVVIVRRQAHCDSGDTVVVTAGGGEATVRRLRRTEAGVLLIPANPRHEPSFYSAHEVEALPVVILGKVAELRGKFG